MNVKFLYACQEKAIIVGSWSTKNSLEYQLEGNVGSKQVSFAYEHNILFFDSCPWLKHFGCKLPDGFELSVCWVSGHNPHTTW